MSIETISAAIRDIPDFPQPGIIFKDITPVLQDPALFAEVVDRLAEPWSDRKIDAVVALDARGFIFGSAVAYKLGTGLILVRKSGKLPGETIGTKYDLEYGSNELEIHADAVAPGDRVVIVDDLLATGGTALAAVNLVEKLGGQVLGLEFMIELQFLKGLEVLKNYHVNSLIKF
jgi:adenine phosphoribosyltransferase